MVAWPQLFDQRIPEERQPALGYGALSAYISTNDTNTNEYFHLSTHMIQGVDHLLPLTLGHLDPKRSSALQDAASMAN